MPNSITFFADYSLIFEHLQFNCGQIDFKFREFEFHFRYFKFQSHQIEI